MLESRDPKKAWVIVVGSGVFSSCYGIFHSYDQCVAWLNTNGFTGADHEIRPVRLVDSNL